MQSESSSESSTLSEVSNQILTLYKSRAKTIASDVAYHTATLVLSAGYSAAIGGAIAPGGYYLGGTDGTLNFPLQNIVCLPKLENPALSLNEYVKAMALGHAILALLPYVIIQGYGLNCATSSKAERACDLARVLAFWPAFASGPAGLLGAKFSGLLSDSDHVKSVAWSSAIAAGFYVAVLMTGTWCFIQCMGIELPDPEQEQWDREDRLAAQEQNRAALSAANASTGLTSLQECDTESAITEVQKPLLSSAQRNGPRPS